MRKEIILAAATLAAVGCGLMSGIFFAFSNFVMGALSLQSAESGIRTMQAINVQIVNPLFLAVFVGTPVLLVLLAIMAALRFAQPGSKLLLIGSTLYLVGALVVTTAINIPLNNRLATLGAASLEASEAWIKYVSVWVAWNHVRTAASLTAAMTLIAAIGQLNWRGD